MSTEESPAPLPGKKGIGLLLRDPNDENAESGTCWTETLPKVKSLNPYWNYSWQLCYVPEQPSDIEFIPMIWWGLKDPEKMRNRIQEEVVPHIQSGKVRRFLAYNEPDHVNLANLSVQEVVDVWNVLEEIEGLTHLVGPSCSYRNRGPEWMEEFMAHVNEKNLRMDWVGIHWYGEPDVEVFKQEMSEYYENYGRRPLLLTELACADWTAKTCETHKCSPHDVLKFMKEAIPWLEETEWIVGYAWFPAPIDKRFTWPSALFDSDGELTDLGRFYASVRTDCPMGDQSIEITKVQYCNES